MESGSISVLEEHTTQTIIPRSEIKEDNGSERSNSKIKFQKEASNLPIYALNKFTTQIKKPPHRKGSPLNWFPRKKVDSYLKRKIKMLQELGGLNSTLDETLEDSNPHYSRVLKEKIAGREAAHRAMEARKAALVEASWCRILRAARIQSKEAEARLLRAEQTAADAFEEAAAIGVIMYDLSWCSEKSYEIETASLGGEGSAFKTAFEVEKEVAAAVKTALIRLSNCSSFGKDEFKEILQKISENPDTVENSMDSLAILSECELENDSLLDSKDSESKIPVLLRNRKTSRQSSENSNMENLVKVMVEKLKCLHEKEISSLATIVATYGLNAALNELEISKPHDTVHPSTQARSLSRRMSSSGSANYYTNWQVRKHQVEPELPSLDKFFVKHLSKLEREVQEAKSANSSSDVKVCSDKSESNASDLGSIFLKHSSKLEKVIEEAKRKEEENEMNCKMTGELSNANHSRAKDVQEVPSLDKVLVKHVSRLEREVQEAKIRRNKENICFANNGETRKSSQHVRNETNDHTHDSLDKILVKHVHWWEREKKKALTAENSNPNQKKKVENNHAECEILDKVLVKHVSRLEKEKTKLKSKEEEILQVNRCEKNSNYNTTDEGGLDQILVKHKSRLEREKMAFSQQEHDKKHSISRREAREKELQEAWGGLSLGNSIKPHLSRLERDKAAWKKADEEERKLAIGEKLV